MLLLQACGGSDSSSEESTVESDGTYQDGTYCSNVDYYNPSTGTRNAYQLNVEVENNEVVRIIFPNGGWLDNDHFSPQELDRSGYCSFTSDKRNQYQITITGSECDFTDENKIRRDEEDAKANVICPRCGFSKYEVDEICSICQNDINDKKKKKEKTCQKCGQYDSFMQRYDDQCSECERKEKRLKKEQEDEERKKREEEENDNN
jgi:hypothetical protein